MWCFFDESYPDEGGVTTVVAVLLHARSLPHIDQVIYRAKRKYFGREHAKDLSLELKGQKLLSNYSFKMAQQYGSSKNHLVVQEVISELWKNVDEHPVYVFGAAVYGAKDILRQPGKLSFPLVEILRRVSAAAGESGASVLVNLVFDEQLADLQVAISLRRFVSGVQLRNVSHYPLIGVSHVTPGIQLADIGAYILGRRAVGDLRFKAWLSQLRQLEWTGTINGYSRMGIQRWDAHPSGSVTVRKKWE
ncbi:MAG: hypothetical protein ACKV0T_12520 [Planctomycetales bacterium]